MYMYNKVGILLDDWYVPSREIINKLALAIVCHIYQSNIVKPFVMDNIFNEQLFIFYQFNSNEQSKKQFIHAIIIYIAFIHNILWYSTSE